MNLKFYKQSATPNRVNKSGFLNEMGELQGIIVKGTENILSIKDKYLNMFSDNQKDNEEQWAILQTRVEGQLNMMAASINGFKPDDSRAGNVMRKWYLKPIFQIRSFLIANYNELFKHSSTLKHMMANPNVRNTNDYIVQPEGISQNATTNWLNNLWSKDNNIIQFINNITSEREMYNVLTGSKDVGYYFGGLSMLRKSIENLIIYIGSVTRREDPDYRHITDLEKTSVINMFLVIGEAAAFYNISVFIGGLLCCLLGQGSNPDDEDSSVLGANVNIIEYAPKIFAYLRNLEDIDIDEMIESFLPHNNQSP